MWRPLFILFIGLFAAFVITSGANTWIGITGTQAETQSNVTAAASGDFVVIPVSTNHYTSGLSWSGKNIRLFGAPQAGLLTSTYGGAATNAYATQCSVVGNSQAAAIYWDSTSGSLVSSSGIVDGNINEVRGLTIFQTNTPSDNTVSIIRMSGNCFMTRVDSNCFWKVKQKCVEFNGWCNGTLDHNFAGTENILFCSINHPLYGGKTWGDGAWADDDFAGTTNAAYVEFNIQTNKNPTANGFIDEEGGGGRIVLRYNSATNSNLTFHGTDGTRFRGVRWYEIYGNLFWVDENNPVMPVWTRFFYPRGGGGVVFSNWALGYQNNVDFSNYRSFLGSWSSTALWGGASGTNTWDTNIASVVATGTHTGGNLSTILTDSGASWSVNQFKSAKYVIQNVSQSASIAIYGTVSTNDAHNITFIGNVASSGISTNMLFNTGESYAIYQIVAMVDQVGRGKGDLLQGGDNPPSLPAVTNSVLGGRTWPRQVADPVYVWATTNYMTPIQQAFIGGPARVFATTQHPTLVSNVDWKQDLVRPGYIPLGVNPLDPVSPVPPPPPSGNIARATNVHVHNAYIGP